MKEQNVVTNEQAREAIDRILNFCEEIDNHIPTDEKTGYKMLPDYFIVSRYLNEVDYSKQKEGEWIGEADGYADGELVYDVWHCSECNHCIDDGTDDADLLPNFCPNCGASMKGGAE